MEGKEIEAKLKAAQQGLPTTFLLLPIAVIVEVFALVLWMFEVISSISLGVMIVVALVVTAIGLIGWLNHREKSRRIEQECMAELAASFTKLQENNG